MDVAIVPGYTRLGYAVRRRQSSWPADVPVDALAGRSVIVTGASSGLGAATAVGLVEAGAQVHAVVRNPDKARDALAGTAADRATICQCDLSDLDDVRRFCGEFEASAKAPNAAPVSAIVHNAGAMPARRTESAQGFELSMAIHVLGPVLMTDLLQPVLAPQARVIWVTSGGMYAQGLPVDDPQYETGEYSPATAYARSKRTQVDLLEAMQRRWPNLVIAATHPGWADTPGVRTSMPKFYARTKRVLRSADEGADTAVWLAATPEQLPGGQLWQDREPRPTNWLGLRRSSDAERTRMWQQVLSMTGLDQN